MSTKIKFFSIGCHFGAQFVSPTLPSNWNDQTRSARGYNYCDNNPQYQHTWFTGLNITCTFQNSCGTLGSLDREVSSVKWRP